MTIDGDQPRQVEETDAVAPVEATQADAHYPHVREAPASRDVWGWVQLVGLGLLAAGVAVLAVFALTVGGR
jgi:hypothetical protein